MFELVHSFYIAYLLVAWGPYKPFIGTHRYIDTLAHTEALGG